MKSTAKKDMASVDQSQRTFKENETDDSSKYAKRSDCLQVYC